jgi:two-component sensor histidine kinase/PAS domain-containing protein
MSDTLLDSPVERSERVSAVTESRSEALLKAQKRSLEMVVQGAPLRTVLAYLTEVVEEQAQGDVVAAILLLDAGGRLWTGAAPSLPEAYNRAVDGLEACEHVGTCCAAAAAARTVITHDIAADPKWADLKSLPLGLGLQAAWSQPILARDGRVLGTFGTYFREPRAPSPLERRLVETLSHTAALAIEGKQKEEEREQQRRVLDIALDAADMGAWRYSLTDHKWWCSPQAQALYGVAQADCIHDEDTVRQVLHPDDIGDMWRAVKTASDPAGPGRYSAEYRVRDGHGGWRWLSVWGATEFEGEGDARRAVAITGASRDITDRKIAEEHRELMVNELNHRVKNTLATVQSIASHTLRFAPDLASARQRIEDRLLSLARAHDLLTTENWSGANLTQVVDRALQPFSSANSIVVSGQPIRLSPGQALALSMAIHELATNAVKYGALSKTSGKVEVEWNVSRANGARTLHFRWAEAGGPEVRAPEREGFGRRMLERGLATELGSPTRLTYAPSGVVFEASTDMA